MTQESKPLTWMAGGQGERSKPYAPAWLNTGAERSENGSVPESHHSVLFVCTGNICRSAFAACCLSSLLAGRGLHVDSAGVGAVVGSPIDNCVARIAERLRVPTRSHVAKQLIGRHLKRADVVLTFGPEHHRWILDSYPDQLRKAVPFKLFVSESEEMLARTDCNWSELVQALFKKTTEPSERNWIEDPYKRSTQIYESVIGQIHEYVERMNVVVSRVGL